MRHYITYTFLLAWLCALPVCAQEVLTSPTPAATNLPETGITDSAVVNDTLPPVVLTYPQILLDMNNAHVEQDSLITMLMEEKTAGVERGTHECPGYRVQIYSSNHPTRGRTGALELEQRIKQTISVQVYVIYATPSWKVRLGDFLTAEQAAEFRDTFKALFPDLADYTYIVRDQVKIR